VDSSRQLTVLEAAVQLDRTLTKILGHLDLLREVPRPEVIESLAELLPTAVAAMTEVRERLIGLCNASTADSVEHTLRARAAIVMCQLDDLRAAEPEVSSTSLRNPGRVQNVGDLSRVLADRIGRINASLSRERRELDGSAPDRSSYATLYHVALDNAEYGYAALGKDFDIAAFLRAGAACESQRFRIACHTIATALESRITVELRGAAPISACRHAVANGAGQ